MRLSFILVSLAIALSLSACGDGTGSNSNTENAGSSSKSDNQSTATAAATDSGPNRLGDNPARNLSVRVAQGNSTTIDLAGTPVPAGTTMRISEQPAHGLVSAPQGNKTTYILKEPYSGSDQFKYALVATDGTTHEYSVTVTVAAPTITKLEVPLWKGDAKAAYSIIHDDYCSGDSKTAYVNNGFDELKKRGLVAGFGVIVDFCNEVEYADLVKMEDAGMEIINHSWSHKDLTKTDTDLNVEIDQAHAELVAKGFKVSFFAFPFDHENDAILRRIRDVSPGYLGARGGDNSSASAPNLDLDDELAPFRARLDCFDFHQDDVPTAPETGVRLSCSKFGRDSNNTAVDILNLYLDFAITEKGWGLRELHGVGKDSSWGWVEKDEYNTHLDYVAAKVASGEVWMDTPTNVTRYMASRAYCGEPSSSNGELDFDNRVDINSCIKYATELDIIAIVEDADAISARQSGKDLEVKSLGNNRFIFPVHPLGGKVVLLRK